MPESAIAVAIQSVRISDIQQAAAENSVLWIVLHRLLQSCQPIRGWKGIGIEQRQPFGRFAVGDGQIVGGGKAGILRAADDLQSGKCILRPVGAAFSAMVWVASAFRQRSR